LVAMIIVTLLCRISIKDKYRVGGLVVTPLHKTNRALGSNPPSYAGDVPNPR
jgi:hypothetical protein